MTTDPPGADAVQERVRAFMAAAILPATEEEICALAAAYPFHRAAMDALYRVEGAKYVDPALRFQAAVRIE